MNRQSFTILILPDRGKSSIKVHLTRAKLLLLLCIALIAFAFLSSFFIHYFYIINRDAEARLLRAENQTYQERTQNYAEKVALIDQRLQQLNQLEQKIKTITSPGNSTMQTQKRSFDPYDSFDGLKHPALSALEEEILDSRFALLNRQLGERIQTLHQLLGQLQSKDSFFQYTPSQWPVVGVISAEFGMRKHPTTLEYTMHRGMDIAANLGTPVLAPANGYVTFVGNMGYFGLVIVLDHGMGITTYYAHLSQSVVTPGQEVKRGQKIGAVGTSGRSTGAHLHYEVRQNGIPINPRLYILEN